jgi:hypothetical protein
MWNIQLFAQRHLVLQGMASPLQLQVYLRLLPFNLVMSTKIQEYIRIPGSRAALGFSAKIAQALLRVSCPPR